MPAAELLGEALTLYGRNASIFIVTAFVGGSVGSLVGLMMSPSTLPVELLWGLLISALTTGLQAPVWLLAAFARSNRPLNIGAIFYGVPALSPAFFSVGAILGTWSVGFLLLAASFPALAPPALCVLIYVAVRFSLAGPAIIFESHPPFQALARSWMLVGGHWWRTFVVQLPVMVFTLVLAIVGGEVAARAGAPVAGAVVGALALSVSVPLIALVETALFEEYLAHERAAAQAAREEAGE